MSAELFKMMAGLDMVHVPYRGSSAAYPDLITGKVHVLFDNLPAHMPTSACVRRQLTFSGAS
jgi:tripartite-type tricarboxylate transporter receptor subunit TctC